MRSIHRRVESERKRLEVAVAARSADLAKANQELQEASLTDRLTGVRSRRFFYMAIPADACQASRAYRSTSEHFSRDHRDLIFYLVDLDHFKQVNEAYGRAAGDQLLVEVARRLSGIVRQSDFLIRWGGEEFLIVCRAAERYTASVLAEKILAVVADRPFEIAGGVFLNRTCSVGWAPYPWMHNSEQEAPVDEVLKLADRALYRAKERGRNQAIGVFPPDASLVSAGSSREDIKDSQANDAREVVSRGPETA